jgi:hypothetical protein
VLRRRKRSGTIVLLPFQDGPRYGRVPWVKPISAELKETAERAQDRWGEAPDLPLRLSRAAEVVESVIGRAGKPPSRGPGCGISKRRRRADRTQTRSDSKRWMMVAPWARLGSALNQNTKSSFNGAFPGKPPRPCSSLAPLWCCQATERVLAIFHICRAT